MLRTHTYQITPDQKAFIDELFARHGGKMTNEQVVAAAKPGSSPIHDLFIWDDKRAAYLYHLRTAGRIMRSYTGWTVEAETAHGSIPINATPIAVKVKETPEADPKWIDTMIAIQDDYMRTQLIEQRLRNVRHSLRQLLVLPELRDLHAILDDVITNYEIVPVKSRHSRRK